MPGDTEVIVGPAVTVTAVVADVDEPLGVTARVYVPAVSEAGTMAVMELSDQLTKVAVTPPIVTVPAAVPRLEPVMVIKEPGVDGFGVTEVMVAVVLETAIVVFAELAVVLEETIPDEVYLYTTTIY